MTFPSVAPNSWERAKVEKVDSLLESHACQLVTRRETSGWSVETFSRSVWSGANGYQRSTSKSLRLLNGVENFASPRGQKSVSLGSAEEELNALRGDSVAYRG